jgi:hypothetical protein
MIHCSTVIAFCASKNPNELSEGKVVVVSKKPAKRRMGGVEVMHNAVLTPKYIEVSDQLHASTALPIFSSYI